MPRSLRFLQYFLGCGFAWILILPGCNRPSPASSANAPAAQSGIPSRQGVEQLEAQLAAQPENLALRDKLLDFYLYNGDTVMGPALTIQRRRQHILWLIEHHPDSKGARAIQARIATLPSDVDSDPEGYAMGRKLWLEQARKPDAKAAVLTGAFRFLRINDKPLAEEFLLRGFAMDPNGRWSSELGRLYYEAILGANALTLQGAVRSVDLTIAHSEFAKEARRKLAVSREIKTLTTAAEDFCRDGVKFANDHVLDFDPVALGRSYVNQAVQLDPQSILAHQVRLNIEYQVRGGQLIGIPVGSSPEQEYRALGFLPKEQRYLRLVLLAEGSYSFLKTESKNTETARKMAETSAREALQLASELHNDANYGTVVYKANIVLGLLAMPKDRGKAVRFLQAAVQAPATEELAYGSGEFTLMLQQALYDAGERNAVADALDKMAETNVSQKGYLQESAKAIRKGGKPLWAIK